jgi:hypothetical protein
MGGVREPGGFGPCEDEEAFASLCVADDVGGAEDRGIVPGTARAAAAAYEGRLRITGTPGAGVAAEEADETAAAGVYPDGLVGFDEWCDVGAA